ncbi:hypothetical protein ACJJTC_003025 [Scirpophaga incertulas]
MIPIDLEPQPQFAAPEPAVSSEPSKATALANGSIPFTSRRPSRTFSEVTERPVRQGQERSADYQRADAEAAAMPAAAKIVLRLLFRARFPMPSGRSGSRRQRLVNADYYPWCRLSQSVLSGLQPAPHPLAPNEKHVLGLKSGNVELDIDVLARALAAAGLGAGASASASASASAAAGASVHAPPAGVTAVGEGQLSAAGAVTAAGSALVNGALPATGVVAFEGALPATGSVILTGNCGCGCPVCLS